MPTDDQHVPYGQLAEDGGRVSVTFERLYPHPPEKVWRALTEPEHLQRWFPTSIEGERSAGAPLRFAHREADLPAFDGRMIRCDPPSVLEFTWGQDVLRFELVPHPSGCLLTLTDTLSELGRAARDAAGWHECLTGLEAAVDGCPAGYAWGEVWKQVHPIYVASFGPEASSIGPPQEFLARQG
jgi:uncharacterized protein YndB with AHSA1/START domain